MEYFNIAFERVVLSTFLYNPEQIESNLDLLTEIDFYYPAHQNIFNTILKLHINNKPVDEEFIKSELTKQKKFDEDCMLDIMSANPIHNLSEYVSEIKELSNQRKLVQLAFKMNDNLSSSEKIQEIKKNIENIENNIATVEDFSGQELLNTHFINKVIFQTGIETIDSKLGGLEQGQLIYITGVEEAGKTHLSYKIMENLSNNFRTGIISLEFGKRKLKERLEGMLKRGQKLNPKNIKASFESHSLVKIEKIIKKWDSEGIKFIVIDSFNLIENFKSSDNNQNIIDTGRRLFKLTQQLDILLLIISTSTKADHKDGNPSIYGGQLLNHYCDQKWHILRDLETETRMLWINKNKQNYTYPKEEIYFNKDGSISNRKVLITEYSEHKESIHMPQI